MHLISIVGPTASGKSHLAILLAERLNGEILSADSRQIYRYLNIGTAKPSTEELQKIPHHFIDILDPSQSYNAGEFGLQARKKISDLIVKQRQPILVGGSGLYVRAVLDGFFNGPGKNSEVREQLEREAKKIGNEAMLEKLRTVDPISADTMSSSRLHRIIRALEVYQLTGKSISEHHTEQESTPPFLFIQFGLEWNRSTLYHRIDERVEWMLSAGLLKEVEALASKGFDKHLNALNTVGYKEAFEFLDHKIPYDEMKCLIQRNTRRYAKRQLTWFRADKRIVWLSVDEQTNEEKLVDQMIEEVTRAEKISPSSN
jgi:tRNA dimethylallyltransferase